jgi:Predicted nucleotide-utilizing enzyme related to molybdopterin-biosynthesis enzyme MoeA
LAVALEEAGIRVTRMLSIGDDREEILNNLRNELTLNDIVITTGGLGPHEGRYHERCPGGTQRQL